MSGGNKCGKNVIKKDPQIGENKISAVVLALPQSGGVGEESSNIAFTMSWTNAARTLIFVSAADQ